MKNEFTKKLFYLLTLFAMSFTATAQEGDAEVVESAPEVVIEMDFNKSLYANNFGNMYMSESPKAMLMASVVPQSYDELKAELLKGNDSKVTDVKTGEYTEAGVKVAYFSGIIKEGGDQIYVEVLIKKLDNKSCITVTSLFEESVKAKYEKEAKKALVSAKVVE